MSGHHLYIVRLLRRVEASLGSGGSGAVRSRLGMVTQKISHADDVTGALERLYGVEGFEGLALRLLWVLTRPLPINEGIANEVMEYEAHQLMAVLVPLPSEQALPVSPRPEPTYDLLYDRLHTFGRSVEALKRDRPAGPGRESALQDGLYRVLNECSALESVARRLQLSDATRFCSACAAFIRYAVEDHRPGDERVVNVLEAANMTIQTVLESYGAEDVEALQNMITLLEDPAGLLASP